MIALSPSAKRKRNLQALTAREYDVCVIGAGIQGAAITLALADAGYRVVVLDQGDFASQTSQESSNFIWGGIKYLENGEFKLVRKLCLARNLLLKHCPSQVEEIRFCLLLNFWKSLLVYLGAWFYWLMGSCATQTPEFVFNGKKHFIAKTLKNSRYRFAVVYSDAILVENDARFVYSFIRKAEHLGAIVCNYTKVIDIKQKNIWQIKVSDQKTAQAAEAPLQIHAKFLINACGAEIQKINKLIGVSSKYSLLFSKGIHSIYPRPDGQDKKKDLRNFIVSFLSSDHRPFFVIPMEQTLCIGTTDTRVDQPVYQANDKDREFIRSNLQNHLGSEYHFPASELISDRCGVRTLVAKKTKRNLHSSRKKKKEKSWLSLSRNHAVEVYPDKRILAVLGGKLTDCINIAQDVLNQLKKIQIFPPSAKTTKRNSIWYGENLHLKNQAIHNFSSFLNQYYSTEKSEKLAQRLWSRYLLHSEVFLEKLRKSESKKELWQEMIEDCGVLKFEWFFCRQFEYVEEWQDFFRRRTKLALLYKRKVILQIQNDLQSLEPVKI